MNTTDPPILAETILQIMQQTRAEDANIQIILDSPDKTVQYLADLFWKKCITNKLIKLAKSNRMTAWTFKPWIEMQKTIRGDRVYEAKFCNFPLDQISSALVSRAIAEGLQARTYDEMHHPDGEGSPYPETFIEITLPKYS